MKKLLIYFYLQGQPESMPDQSHNNIRTVLDTHFPEFRQMFFMRKEAINYFRDDRKYYEKHQSGH